MPTCVRADKITRSVEKEGFREEEWQIMKCGIHMGMMAEVADGHVSFETR